MGRTVGLPVEVRRAGQWGVQYLVPADCRPAHRLPHRPRGHRSGPGQGPGGPGRVPLRRHRPRPVPRGGGQLRGPAPRRTAARLPRRSGLREFASGAVGAYIHRLPVDQEFTCAAGRDIWGFPKWVTSIDIDEPEPGAARRGAGTSVRLVDDGVHVLSLTMAAGGRIRLPTQAPPSYSFADGVLRRTTWTTSARRPPVGSAGPLWCWVITRWPTNCDRSAFPSGPCSPRRPQ